MAKYFLGFLGGVLIGALGTVVLGPQLVSDHDSGYAARPDVFLGTVEPYYNHGLGAPFSESEGVPGHPYQLELATVQPTMTFTAEDIAELCLTPSYWSIEPPRQVSGLSANVTFTRGARLRLKDQLMTQDGVVNIFRYRGMTLNSFAVSSERVSAFPASADTDHSTGDFEFGIPLSAVTSVIPLLHLMAGKGRITACNGSDTLSDLPGYDAVTQQTIETYDDLRTLNHAK